MKKTILTIVMATLLLPGPQAFGEICAVDNVPAATLLIPYFTVPLGGAPFLTHVTTVFSVTNISPSPVIAHVTLWTDWSRPELNFDIYLGSYAVQHVNMRDLFWGPNVDPEVQAAFSGVPGDDDLCGGSWDGSYHGYVTIDANMATTTLVPSDPDYWNGCVTYQDETGNILMGDYQYVDVFTGRAEGFTMVHIEAFAEIAEAAATADEPIRSFYSRYLGTGIDGREPLPTTYSARYNANNPLSVQDTYFQIWRTGPPGPPPPRGPCGSNPFSACNGADTCAGLDLDFAVANSNYSLYIINDEVCIDLETQNLNVFDDLDSGFNNGWYYLNLQSSCTDGQAYLTVTQFLPTLSGGWDGVALDGSCTQFAEAAPTTLPKQPTEQNPFE